MLLKLTSSDQNADLLWSKYFEFFSNFTIWIYLNSLKNRPATDKSSEGSVVTAFRILCYHRMVLPPSSYTSRDHRWPQRLCFLPLRTLAVPLICSCISASTCLAGSNLQIPAVLFRID